MEELKNEKTDLFDEAMDMMVAQGLITPETSLVGQKWRLTKLGIWYYRGISDAFVLLGMPPLKQSTGTFVNGDEIGKVQAMENVSDASN